MGCTEAPSRLDDIAEYLNERVVARGENRGIEHGRMRGSTL
jgi:hypothetical protein